MVIVVIVVTVVVAVSAIRVAVTIVIVAVVIAVTVARRIQVARVASLRATFIASLRATFISVARLVAIDRRWRWGVIVSAIVNRWSRWRIVGAVKAEYHPSAERAEAPAIVLIADVDDVSAARE
jgi:hypothetical protein